MDFIIEKSCSVSKQQLIIIKSSESCLVSKHRLSTIKSSKRMLVYLIRTIEGNKGHKKRSKGRIKKKKHAASFIICSNLKEKLKLS